MNQVIKLELGQDVRRVGRPPDTIEELKKIAEKIFEIESVQFQYKDLDGDMITCSSQQEYIEALGILGPTVRFKVLGLKDVINLRYHYSELPVHIPSTLAERNQIQCNKLQKTCDKFTNSTLLTDTSIQITELDLYLEEIWQNSSRLSINTKIICRNCSKFIIGAGFICRACELTALCSACEPYHQHLLIKAYGRDIERILSKFNEPKTYTSEDKLQLLSQIQEADPKNTKDLNPELKNTIGMKKRNNTIPETKTHAIEKNEEETKDSKHVLSATKEKATIFNKSPFDYLPCLKPSLSAPSNKVVSPKSIPKMNQFKSPSPDKALSEPEPLYNRAKLQENLSKLEDLGFTDKNLCFKALIDNQYNVEKAAALLFENT